MAKTVIVYGGSFTRSVSVEMPSTLRAEQLVDALNAGDATQVNNFFICSDRFAVKIEKNSVENDAGNCWRVQSVDEAADAADGGCCGCGGCSAEADAEADAKLAAEGLNAVMNIAPGAGLRTAKTVAIAAFELLQKDQLSAARKVITAASVLYANAGSEPSDEGVWLLSVRSFVCSAEGKYKAAWKYGLQSINMARTVYGEDSASFAVILNNIAEGQIDAKKYESAEKLLIQGIGLINSRIADNTVNFLWAKGARSEALRNYRRLLRETGRGEEADGMEEK